MSRRISLDTVCQLIRALLPERYPVIEDVARALRTSPRTLQRRLNEQGVSYSELVERCRREKACKSLRRSDDTIRDIAARLGYRDVSSFSRAFRRWTGTAPRAWRNAGMDREGERQQPGS